MRPLDPPGRGRRPIVPRAVAATLAAQMDVHDRGRPGTFPGAGWATLTDTGVTAATTAGADVAAELAAVRAVSAADVSLGRVLDGHYNAVQRLLVQVGDDVAGPELAAVVRGELSLGVWGADPGPDEGQPARLRAVENGGWVLDGVKCFCSGAGGLQRAFVLARAPQDDAPVRLVYVDLTQGTAVDRDWFQGAGMRGSASHRVVFDGAPVRWIAEQPRALMAQPWFAQDGLRTAAGWAGGADTVVGLTIDALRAKAGGGDLEALAVARLLGAQRAMDLWLRAGAEAVAGADDDLGEATLLAREAIAAAVRTILDEASRVLGSRPFAVGGRIERARRDLQTYLLQHRLEPALVRLGDGVLATHRP